MFELLIDFSSPDRSKLPCSADSGTTRVQNVKRVLPKIIHKKNPQLLLIEDFVFIV
jgi:hypothetical protein